MIVDASTLVAIVLKERLSASCREALAKSPINRISAATLLEASIVVDQLPDPRASVACDALLLRLGLRVEPVTEHQASIARVAYRGFGRRSGHPARLNFGDCFAYALAKDFDEPLLFIGQDFIHTDVRPALT